MIFVAWCHGQPCSVVGCICKCMLHVFQTPLKAWSDRESLRATRSISRHVCYTIIVLATATCQECLHHVLCNQKLEKKRKEKTTPFGVNLLRSQVLYRAAQPEASLYVPLRLTAEHTHHFETQCMSGSQRHLHHNNLQHNNLGPLKQYSASPNVWNKSKSICALYPGIAPMHHHMSRQQRQHTLLLDADCQNRTCTYRAARSCELCSTLRDLQYLKREKKTLHLLASIQWEAKYLGLPRCTYLILREDMHLMFSFINEWSKNYWWRHGCIQSKTVGHIYAILYRLYTGS